MFYFFLFFNILSSFFFNTINANNKQTETAYFAGGCFWCVQADFDKIKGIISTTVGYMGGNKPNPTYEEVSSGNTNYVETVEIIYSPDEISYNQLLDIYFHNIDPTMDDGQFCDKGKQYRPVIYYHDNNQKLLAEKYKQELINSKEIQPILVQILPESTFFPAEKYHQKYYKKHPFKYRYYRLSCKRDKRLRELWKSP